MTKEKIQEYIISAMVAFAGFVTPLLIPICLIIGFDVIDWYCAKRLHRNTEEKFKTRRHVDRFIGHMATIAVAFILQSFILKEQPVIIIAEGAVAIAQIGRIRISIKRLTGSDLIGELPKIERDDKNN